MSNIKRSILSVGQKNNNNNNNNKKHTKRQSTKDVVNYINNKRGVRFNKNNKSKYKMISSHPELKLALSTLLLRVTECKTELIMADNSISLTTTIRGMIGNQIFHMYLGTAASLTSVSTILGYTAAIGSIISGCGNWSSCAAIFDAFTVDAFTLELTPYAGSLDSTYIAYDADNTSSITPSKSVMTNYTNLKVYCPNPAGTSTLASGDNPGFQKPLTYHHEMWPHVPNNDTEIISASTDGLIQVNPLLFLVS